MGWDDKHCDSQNLSSIWILNIVDKEENATSKSDTEDCDHLRQTLSLGDISYKTKLRQKQVKLDSHRSLTKLILKSKKDVQQKQSAASESALQLINSS